MSYASTRSNPVTVAAVIAVHVGIGYAFLCGLAIRVIPEISVVTMADLIPDDTPPPPPSVEPASKRVQPATAEPRPTAPPPVLFDLPALPNALPTQPLPTVPSLPLPEARPALSSPATDLARSATVRGDRAAWVTTDDYPAAALREGAQGTAALRVTVGTDGRVSDCAVTASSGNTLLDQAACRAYTRRARFTPATDGGGHPVVSTRVDRVTWLLPR